VRKLGTAVHETMPPSPSMVVGHLHVELALQLGPAGGVEVDAGVQQQGPAERLTGLDLAVGAGGAARATSRRTASTWVESALSRTPVETGQSAAWTERPPVSARQRSSARNGQNGGEQLRRRDQAAVQGRVGAGVLALPEPAAGPAHVPVREVVHEAGDAGRAAEGVEVVEGGGDGCHRVIQFAQHHRSSTWVGSTTEAAGTHPSRSA